MVEGGRGAQGGLQRSPVRELQPGRLRWGSSFGRVAVRLRREVRASEKVLAASGGLEAELMQADSSRGGVSPGRRLRLGHREASCMG